MNFLMQKIMKCENCTKEFLYFGDHVEENETYFCSPECSEKANS